ILLVVERGIFGGIGHFHSIGRGLHPAVAVVVDVGAARAAALGGHEYYAVGRLHTVDAGAGRVLEDFYRSNVVLVQEAEFLPFYGGNGSGHFTLALGAVAHHYHVVKALRLRRS
nr:hypothetical protein [Tanacetum cinerariifolium]